MRRGAQIREYARAQAADGPGAESALPAHAEVAGNARLVHEYMDYLRVEKGVWLATCEAYARDLEQFAEQVERRDALLMTAADTDVKDFMARLRANHVGCADGGAQAELPAGVLSLAAAG